ncbi:MAG: ATP-binding cassette domain-containing protein [Acidimicrobiia bacterium]|nr:ATP-binding cassette domain-containing protein [Acidimicrobiia bacterium]
MVIAEACQDMQRTARSLNASGVSFGYGERSNVLSDVTLQMDRSEAVVIYGQPEVGKSTLARLLAGDLTPDGGSLHVDSRGVDGEVSLVSFPPAERWPQDWGPEEYLSNCFSPLGSPFLARRMARDVLVAAGLDAQRLTGRDGLSHRVRAEIAALGALVDMPCWLVLDEPDFKVRGSSEVWSLMGFISQCARACRAGLVWLTSSALPEVCADRSFALEGGGLRSL